MLSLWPFGGIRRSWKWGGGVPTKSADESHLHVEPETGVATHAGDVSRDGSTPEDSSTSRQEGGEETGRGEVGAEREVAWGAPQQAPPSFLARHHADTGGFTYISYSLSIFMFDP